MAINSAYIYSYQFITILSKQSINPAGRDKAKMSFEYASTGRLEAYVLEELDQETNTMINVARIELEYGSIDVGAAVKPTVSDPQIRVTATLINGVLTVIPPKRAIDEMVLVNLDGSVAGRWKISSSLQPGKPVLFPLRQGAKGMYLLQIKSGKQVFTTKVAGLSAGL